MSRAIPHTASLSNNGLPYVKVGDRAEPLVIFTSGSPDNTVPDGIALKPFVDGAGRLAEKYTVYFVKRKRGLPAGYTTQDMARDYAAMIRQEIAAPCHIIGVSAGGFIAEHFAVTYPELVKRLVIAIAGYRLDGVGRQIVLEWRDLAAQNELTRLLRRMVTSVTKNRLIQFVASVGAYGMGMLLGRRIHDLGDFVVTLDALLAHDAWDTLARIEVPVLIVAGDEDVFYPVAMLREMDERIPDSRLIIYPGVGHGALEFRKKDFERDVMSFLENG